jgi:hypothetical protein
MRNDGIYSSRCKITYTQHDLVTGIDKEVKHTAEVKLRDLSDPATGTGGSNTVDENVNDLDDQIIEELNKNPNTVISNISMVSCKDSVLYIHYLWKWEREKRWGKYTNCDDHANGNVVNNLYYHRPDKIGYNVHLERLTKNEYGYGCKHHTKPEL